MDIVEINEIWTLAKAHLFSEIPESDWAWINLLEPTGYASGIFTVITEHSMAMTVVRSNYLQKIKECLKKVTGDTVDFKVIVDKETMAKIKKERQKQIKANGGLSIKVKEATPEKQETDPMEHLTKMQSTGLNLKNKFENFVVGENSKTAYAISKIVAEHPAEKYNPLFIYGGSGLGKTHLMQAIGQYAIFNHARKKVKYIKTQDFVNQYIDNVNPSNKNKTELMTKFRQRFRNVDILLIDDIQFVESKIKFMNELFYIFETLQQLNKQIVITSDRLPKDIPTLPDRLKTRFEMGIVVDIQPPPLETRIEILKKWASDQRLFFNDDVIEFVAQNFTNNVRELEGAFNKITAIADIEGVEITLDFAKRVLKVDTQMKKITINNIAQTVAEFFDITLDNMKSPARSQNISDARKYTIYLAREMTNMSYEDIAKFLNKKHTTMLYSYEKIVEAADRNVEVKETIRELKQAVKCNLK